MKTERNIADLYNKLNNISKSLVNKIDRNTETLPLKSLFIEGGMNIGNLGDITEYLKLVTTSGHGFMSKEDKTKLDSIETGSNKYIHPDTHSADMIVENILRRFVTDIQIAAWDSKAEGIHNHHDLYYTKEITDERYVQIVGNTVPIGDKEFKLSKSINKMIGKTRETGVIHGGINISENGLDLKTNYSANIVLNNDDIGEGVLRVQYGSGRINLVEVNQDGILWRNRYEVLHTGLLDPNNVAEKNHGVHIPTPEVANIVRFLRNDNTWQDVTPSNIGAVNKSGDVMSGQLSISRNTTIGGGLPSSLSNAWLLVGTSTNGIGFDDNEIACNSDYLIIHAKNYMSFRLAGTERVRLTPTDLILNNKNVYHEGNLVNATQSVGGLLSNGDKTKLDGIEDNANNYSHPSTHSVDMIVETENKKFVSQAQMDKWTGKAEASHGSHIPTPDTVVVSNKFLRSDNTWQLVTPGLLDAYNRNEIDNMIAGIVNNMDWKESVATFADIAKTYPNPEDGWTVNVKDTNATYRYDGTTWIGISTNTLEKVTSSKDGLMSKEDKNKIDGIEIGANKYVHPSKHSVEEITTTTNKMFVSQSQIDEWNSKSGGQHTHPASEVVENSSKRFVTDAQITSWTSKAEGNHNHDSQYNTKTEITSLLAGKANSSHGNHIPNPESANAAKFLRNDNTWQLVTPGNIGTYTKSEIDTKVNERDRVYKIGATGSGVSYVKLADLQYPIGDGRSLFTAIITGASNYGQREVPVFTLQASTRGYSSGAIPADFLKVTNITGASNRNIVFISKLNDAGNRIEIWMSRESYSYEITISNVMITAGSIHMTTSTTDPRVGTFNTHTPIRFYKTSDFSLDQINSYTKPEVDSLLTGKANSSHGNHVPTTESANNARFLRNDNTWQAVTPGNIGAATTASVTNIDNTSVKSQKIVKGRHILSPKGGEYSTSTSQVTGSLWVKLPTTFVNSMMSFWIDVYEYTSNQSFSVFVSGYIYSSGNTWQHNPSAFIVGSNNSYTVRFGNSGGRPIVYIGETNKVWNYPQFIVRDVHIGYSYSDSNAMSENWETGIGTTHEGVTATINKQVWHSGNFDPNTKANSSHGNHVPTVEGANNTRFLRNDNTWQAVTPGNIGAYTKAEIDNAWANGAKDGWYQGYSPSMSGDVNAVFKNKKTGFFCGSGMGNALPWGSHTWKHYYVTSHANAAGYTGIIGMDFDGGEVGFKSISNGVDKGWKRLWHHGNFDPNTKLNTSGGTISGTLTHRNQLVLGTYVRMQDAQYIHCNPSTDGGSIGFLSKEGGWTCRVNNAGYVYANRLYNAVWNDYAEYFPKPLNYKTEPGDIIALNIDSDKEEYIKATEATASMVVGCHSDEYGNLIGGDEPPKDYGGSMEEYNNHKYIPIGLAGRVRAKCIGSIKKGDDLVISEIPGVARAFDPNKDSVRKIFGMAVEDKEFPDSISRVKMFIKG